MVKILHYLVFMDSAGYILCFLSGVWFTQHAHSSDIRGICLDFIYLTLFIYPMTESILIGKNILKCRVSLFPIDHLTLFLIDQYNASGQYRPPFNMLTYLVGKTRVFLKTPMFSGLLLVSVAH